MFNDCSVGWSLTVDRAHNGSSPAYFRDWTTVKWELNNSAFKHIIQKKSTCSCRQRISPLTANPFPHHLVSLSTPHVSYYLMTWCWDLISSQVSGLPQTLLHHNLRYAFREFSCVNEHGLVCQGLIPEFIAWPAMKESLSIWPFSIFLCLDYWLVSQDWSWKTSSKIICDSWPQFICSLNISIDICTVYLNGFVKFSSCQSEKWQCYR